MKFRYFSVVLALCFFDKTSAQILFNPSFDQLINDADDSCYYFVNPEMQNHQKDFFSFSDHNVRAEEKAEDSYFMTSYVFYEFTSISDSVPMRKSEQTTKENGDLILLQLYSWDVELMDWFAWRKWIHRYNTQGEKAYTFMLTYDKILNDWVKSSKESLSYDESGAKIYFTHEWNEDQKLWFLVNRTESQYDESEKVRVSARYRLDSNTNKWIGCCKNEYSYDVNGNNTQFIQYEWNSTTNDWIQWGKNEVSYDDEGNTELNIRYEWDNKIAEWEFVRKSEYNYNAEGDQFLDKFEWDISIDGWILKSMEENYYDNNGNRIIQVEYLWDSNTNSRIGSFKKICIYDDNGFNSVRINYTWDNEINNWKLRSKEFIDNSRVQTTGLDDFVENDVVLYPNPTDSYLNFSGISQSANIQIFSTHGILVKQLQFANETLDISNLPKGLFIITVNQQNQQLIKRKILKK